MSDNAKLNPIPDDQPQSSPEADEQKQTAEKETRKEESQHPAEAKAHAEEKKLPAEAKTHAEEKKHPAEAKAHAEEKKLPAEAKAHAEENKHPAEAKAHAEEKKHPIGPEAQKEAKVSAGAVGQPAQAEETPRPAVDTVEPEPVPKIQKQPEETEEEYWQRQDQEIEYSKDEYEKMMRMYESTLTSIEEGQLIRGKIIRIAETHVVLDIGFKSEGTVPVEEFKTKEELAVGAEVDVFLEKLEDEDGIVVLSKKKADFIKVWDMIRRAHEDDELVEGTLVRRIKGGVVVDLLGVDAFLPGSQIALRRIPNIDELIGQSFKFKIIKINKRRRNIVISRRVILETEREAKKEKLLQELEMGQVREGVVKNITDFGAFIDLGGVDGLLHITDMSWGRVSHPSEMVALGDKLKVKILDLDFESGRISLGHKQLTPYPWENAAAKYPVGSKVRGKVVSITNYGAFVELEKGIEGLVHISEMSWTRHIRHPSKILAIGDTVEAMVLSINPEEEKISLGIKQVEADPWLTLNQKYPLGTRIEGRVRNLTSYGAFVEIEDGIDGLVHISDMSWTKRVHHPSEMVKKGDKVKVMVLNMDVDNRRISLGMKQLAQDPWEQLGEQFSVGTEVSSPIVRLLDKGVVVDLGDDVEGFVPISQMGLKGIVNSPAEVFQIGNTLELRVIESDPQNRRIVLAVKDLASVRKLVKEKLKEEKEAEAAKALEAEKEAEAAKALEAEKEAPEAAEAPEAEKEAPEAAEAPEEPEPATAEAEAAESGETEPEEKPEVREPVEAAEEKTVPEKEAAPKSRKAGKKEEAPEPPEQEDGGEKEAGPEPAKAEKQADQDGAESGEPEAEEKEKPAKPKTRKTKKSGED